MPASIQEELAKAARIFEEKLTAGDKRQPIIHTKEYENGTLKRITIFVNSASSEESEKSKSDVVNSPYANLDLIVEGMIEAAVSYAVSLSPGINQGAYAHKLRADLAPIMIRAHHNLHNGDVALENTFKNYLKEIKDRIQKHAKEELGLTSWNMDRFHSYARERRLQAEVVVVTHQNGQIAHFGYQSGSETNAHTKGIADSPPNSTSFFNYEVRADGSTVLLDVGHSLASPAPKRSEDASRVIRQNLLVATERFLRTKRALETPPASYKKDFKSESPPGIGEDKNAYPEVQQQVTFHQAEEEPTVTFHMQAKQKLPLHVFHILLTTPQAAGANDGQWQSWLQEKESIAALEREGIATITIDGEQVPVQLHMICSGINERWGSDIFQAYKKIHQANNPAIQELIRLLEQQPKENKAAAQDLIAAIQAFNNPKSPYFYMADGGNALRFNQVLSLACQLTGSVYLVGCKSGNDRTYVQTLFNAAAHGAANPGLIHLINTVLDTLATPNAKMKKFGTALTQGFFRAANPRAEDKENNRPALKGEIQSQASVQKAAEDYSRYRPVGTASHKVH